MINEVDCVEPGLACASTCEALNRGAKGRRADQLSRPFFMAADDVSGLVIPMPGDLRSKYFIYIR